MTRAASTLQTHPVENQPQPLGPRDPHASDAVLRGHVAAFGGQADALGAYG